MTTHAQPIVSFSAPLQARELVLPEMDAGRGFEPPHKTQQFHIRLANSAGRREAASLLLKQMYGWRGYAVSTPMSGEPNQLALVADTDGKVVSTMTICFDSGAGLPADENFPTEINALRGGGRRIAEPSRLAIARHLPKRLFAALIHISFIYAYRLMGFSDYIIEVNPRHQNFYRRKLGFQLLAEERLCTRVHAPAVLLQLELQYMEKQIQQFGGTYEKSVDEKSFYPYFFSSKDEQGIASRICAG